MKTDPQYISAAETWIYRWINRT